MSPLPRQWYCRHCGGAWSWSHSAYRHKPDCPVLLKGRGTLDERAREASGRPEPLYPRDYCSLHNRPLWDCEGCEEYAEHVIQERGTR